MVSAPSPSCGQLAPWPGWLLVQRGISSAVCGSRPKIDHGGQHLQVDLHLIVGAGRAEDAPELAVLEHHRRVHGVAHALAGLQPVGVAGREVPVGHAVVQQHAGIARDDAGAEGGVDALDAGDGIALARRRRRNRWCRRRPPRRLRGRSAARSRSMRAASASAWSSDSRRSSGTVLEARVGAVAFAVEEGELFGFDQHMDALGRRERREIEMLDDLQHLQQDEAGRVGRRLADLEAAIA